MADRRHDNNRPNHTNNGRHDSVRVVRQPVHVQNNHYRFNNGYTVRYTRPYIGVRYTNYRVRPSILVENYEAVSGYVWVRGNWNWNGSEWIWISGHYAVAY